MASVFSHAIVALAMGKAFQNTKLSWRELFLGALCSVVPNLDVIGFYERLHLNAPPGRAGMKNACCLRQH